MHAVFRKLLMNIYPNGGHELLPRETIHIYMYNMLSRLESIFFFFN